MIALYIFVRLFLWALGAALVAFVILVYMAFLMLTTIWHFLRDQNTRQPPPRVSPSHPRRPRNERLFYSDRR